MNRWVSQQCALCERPAGCRAVELGAGSSALRVSLRLLLALQAVAEEAADRSGVGVVVVGDVAHVVVDVVLEGEEVAPRRWRGVRGSAAFTSSAGALSWLRHTTIGTAQISHSAIQHNSSSKNHGVIRASSQRSQLGPSSRRSHQLRVSHVESGSQLAHERGRPLGAFAVEQPADERGTDDHAVGFLTHLDGLLDGRHADTDEHRQVGDRLQTASPSRAPTARARPAPLSRRAARRHTRTHATARRSAATVRRAQSARRAARSRHRPRRRRRTTAGLFEWEVGQDRGRHTCRPE